MVRTSKDELTETIRFVLTPKELEKAKSLAYRYTGGNTSELMRRLLRGEIVIDGKEKEKV